MRGFRSLMVLVALGAGLAAYIFLYENKRDPADSVPKKDKLVTIEPGKIEELEVHTAKGEVTKLKKTGNDWQISGAEPISADQGVVGALTASIEGLEAQSTVVENPASVKDYGLDPPRISVAFRAAGETAMRKLLVGNKTPMGSDLYARIEGQPKVVLISAYIEDSLNKSTFDFRDKSVLAFSRDGVDSLKLDVTGSPAISFARKAGNWRLSEPVDAKADFGTVDGIVSGLAMARMKELVTTASGPAGTAVTSAAAGLSAEDAKKFGFDKPQAQAIVGAGSTRATLVIGGKKDDAAVYARDLARPLVFTVDNSVLEQLKHKPDDMRVKDLFEFRTFTVNGVDLTYSGQTYGYKKEKPAPKDEKKDPKATATPAATPSPAPPPAPEAEVWKQVKPAAKDADQTKVSDLLSGISNLRAEKFADKPLASGQDFVVVARFGDAASPTEEKVTFRKSGDVVHAIRAGEGGAAIVPTADFDKVITQLKELAGIK